MCPRPRSTSAAHHLQTVRTFGRWDCINAGQRESATESRFEACTSLLTSQAIRRTPPKCGAFRFQPPGSPLRQTGCWRKADSNCWSHFDGDALRNSFFVSCTPSEGRSARPRGETDGSNPLLSSGESGELRTHSSRHVLLAHSLTISGSPEIWSVLLRLAAHQVVGQDLRTETRGST
jgi:hypothetical protein